MTGEAAGIDHSAKQNGIKGAWKKSVMSGGAFLKQYEQNKKEFVIIQA